MQLIAKLFVRYCQSLIQSSNWIRNNWNIAKMKIKTTASKLQNATVSHISLVEKGANRIPFKIIKQENGMINLSKLFKSAKEETVSLQVSAIVIQKSANVEDIKAVLKSNGFIVDNLEETDDTVILKQEDFDMSEVSAIKMNDDMVILTKSFSGYSLDASNSTFADRAKAEGFFPSINSASETLIGSLREVLYGSANIGEAVTKSDSLLEDFHGYVKQVIQGLPSAAFKAEKEVSEIVKMSKDKPKEWTSEEIAAMEAEKLKEKEKLLAKKDEDTTEVVVPTELPVVTGDTPENEPSSVTKAVNDALANVVKSITDLTATVSAIQKQVSDVAKSQETVTSQLSEVEKVAKTAANKVQSTIIGTPTSADADALVTKGETEYVSDFINLDTGFQPQVRGHRSTLKNQKY